MTSIPNQFIGFFFTNAKVDFFNARFVSISQRILWQSLCFRWIVRYHSRFSRADLDDLCDRSQSFLIRQLLAVNLLTIGTVDTSLDGPLTLNTRSGDLTTSFWNLICILLVNRKINLFYSNLIICSQFQLRSLMNRSCIRSCTIFRQFWNLLNWSCLGTGSVLCQFRNFVNWGCFRTGAIFRQFWSLTNWGCLRTSSVFCQFWCFMNWSCLRTGAILCQFRNFMNWSRFRISSIFRQFRNFMNWRCFRICTIFCQFWNFMNRRCFWSCAIFCQFWNFVNWSFFWYRVSWSCSN